LYFEPPFFFYIIVGRLGITIGYSSRLSRIMALGAEGASHNSLSVKFIYITGRREMSRISGFHVILFGGYQMKQFYYRIFIFDLNIFGLIPPFFFRIVGRLFPNKTILL